MSVAVLFADPRGVYAQLVSRDCLWDVVRDARTYDGPDPVVAHPPCQLWTNLAAVNWTRYQHQRPAWYVGGSDDGCFLSALQSVLKYGGVLEHPAESHAWQRYGLTTPTSSGWTRGLYDPYWVCEVWQSAYQHRCRKRTWLLYCGLTDPAALRWDHRVGTHQIGLFDRKKPSIVKQAASATPRAFAETLIALAAQSGGAR